MAAVSRHRRLCIIAAELLQYAPGRAMPLLQLESLSVDPSATLSDVTGVNPRSDVLCRLAFHT